MEDEVFEPTEVGTAQGSNLSPVLANIYMHYVLTMWFNKIVKPQFKGECYITVYADDYVCCFQYKWEAERFYEMLKERLGKFNLELEPSKSRLVEFGRFAENSRKKRGEGNQRPLTSLDSRTFVTNREKGILKLAGEPERRSIMQSL